MNRVKKSTFSLLYILKKSKLLKNKLEKATIELVATNRKIEELTREFEEKYLTK